MHSPRTNETTFMKLPRKSKEYHDQTLWQWIATGGNGELSYYYSNALVLYLISRAVKKIPLYRDRAVCSHPITIIKKTSPTRCFPCCMSLRRSYFQDNYFHAVSPHLFGPGLVIVIRLTSIRWYKQTYILICLLVIHAHAKAFLHSYKFLCSITPTSIRGWL